MANSGRSNPPMPLFVIDTCPSDENVQPLKISKQIRSTKFLRSVSLTDFHQTYKDLHGAIHSSFSKKQFQALQTRSRSYPNNYLSIYANNNEKFFENPSPTTSIHMNMNSLDPHTAGTQTPGGSSSRYSLYGSFFDLSESGYLPNSDQRSEQKFLTAGGHPLLFLDHPTHLVNNTFEDKCADWLRRLPSNTT